MCGHRSEVEQDEPLEGKWLPCGSMKSELQLLLEHDFDYLQVP